MDDSDCLSDTSYCNTAKHRCQPITCQCDPADRNAQLLDCEEPKESFESVEKRCNRGFIVANDDDNGNDTVLFDEDGGYGGPVCSKAATIVCHPEPRDWLLSGRYVNVFYVHYALSFSDTLETASKCVEGCASDADCDAATGFGRCGDDCACAPTPCPAAPNDPNSRFDVNNTDGDVVVKTCSEMFVLDRTTGDSKSVGTTFH